MMTEQADNPYDGLAEPLARRLCELETILDEFQEYVEDVDKELTDRAIQGKRIARNVARLAKGQTEGLEDESESYTCAKCEETCTEEEDGKNSSNIGDICDACFDEEDNEERLIL